ncbi:MAG: hypothetical protein QNK03_24220 [Myxococcota bacterium]|nr:hypothetical protein [Myxococcota bacterium]
MRALVLEAHASLRASLGRMLAGRFDEVRSCATSAEAAVALRERAPAVFLFDLDQVDGELLEALRDESPERGPALIALTAGAGREIAVGGHYGLVVQKPITADRLERALDEALALSAAPGGNG